MGFSNEAREYALDQAIRTYELLLTDGAFKKPKSLPAVFERVYELAESYYSWINGPATLTIVVGEVTNHDTGDVVLVTYQGDVMQLVDNQQVALTVVETDSKGVALQDTLTWTIDNETVATLDISTDTQTCTVVAGITGSATVTVTDGTLSATLAVDVIPGTATAISITPGTPVDQPTPTPAA
jgi:hypothetical protein